MQSKMGIFFYINMVIRHRVFKRQILASFFKSIINKFENCTRGTTLTQPKSTKSQQKQDFAGFLSHLYQNNIKDIKTPVSYSMSSHQVGSCCNFTAQALEAATW